MEPETGRNSLYSLIHLHVFLPSLQKETVCLTICMLSRMMNSFQRIHVINEEIAL